MVSGALGQGCKIMKIAIIALLLLAWLVSVPVMAQDVSTHSLTVRIENIHAGRGHLMIGVFNDENDFPNNHFVGKRIATIDETMTVVFHDLPVGQYAVSVFQDSNNNGRLDTNIFGIPREKFGFSNGVRRSNFQASLFRFDDDTSITIRIR